MTDRSDSTTGPLVACMALLVIACATDGGDTAADGSTDPNDFLIVDCRLPPKIKTLGQHSTYATARRVVRTAAVVCRIRGGEYVSYDRANYATALQAWLPVAKSGDPEAQNYVGEIHQKGLGVAPDYAVALAWYRKAAAQGYAPAQINLGQLYELGRGVARDPVEAQRWFRRASGLEDLGLAFVPSAAPANVHDELRTRLDESERKADALRAEKQALVAMRSRDEQERAALAENQESERAIAARDIEHELAVRETKSEEQVKEIARLSATIALLEQDAESARAAAATLSRAEPSQPEVPVSGPSIQLIDPGIQLQRGIQLAPSVARVVTDSKTRTIVGRVDAAAGLYALTINGRDLEFSANGLFKSSVAVPDSGLGVTIIAVDGQGKSAQRRFQLVSSTAPESVAQPALPAVQKPKIDFGNYHALVIGNDQHASLPDLETASRDAEAVASLLRSRYGFEITALRNANRYQILSALNELRGRLDKNDNLVVYYAGHGELDRVNMRGYWLPVDAEAESTANWISNTAITDILNAMSVRHVLVVADSCYSGALTRSALARLEAGMTDEAREAWVKAMVGKRSRTALTSGGLEPVLDSGGGAHSIFARVFLEVLETNRGVLEGQQLFHEVSARVTWAAEGARFEQVPQYAPIKYAGHESGDFFFVPR